VELGWGFHHTAWRPACVSVARRAFPICAWISSFCTMLRAHFLVCPISWAVWWDFF
jgi:hypothetical protein